MNQPYPLLSRTIYTKENSSQCRTFRTVYFSVGEKPRNSDKNFRSTGETQQAILLTYNTYRTWRESKTGSIGHRRAQFIATPPVLRCIFWNIARLKISKFKQPYLSGYQGALVCTSHHCLLRETSSSWISQARQNQIYSIRVHSPALIFHKANDKAVKCQYPCTRACRWNKETGLSNLNNRFSLREKVPGFLRQLLVDCGDQTCWGIW